MTPPTWQAARNGLPGDAEAVNQAAQLSQFLGTHGIIPVYAGSRAWTAVTSTGSTRNSFSWVTGGTGWLPAYDADQPVTGLSAVGRVEVAVQAIGSGADLQVTLYPDNGSGSPATGSPLASTIVPAAHITSLGAAGSLASAGPLATSASNACLLGASTTTAWTQPAVSVNGAADFACPVTSGNWTVFLGGYDSTAAAATASTVAVQYLGGGAVSGAVLMPSLPQPAFYLCAAATGDTMIAAGGTDQSGGHFTGVWTAAWDPAAGTLGAWSSQQGLPQATINGAMATWGDNAYVAGGSTDGTNANATAAVWYAPVSNGQIASWTAAPSLPQATIKPYLAVIGNWLIAAGGVNTAGTALTTTWYAAISSAGVPGPWRAGPALPSPAYAFSPNFDLIVTDSVVIIVSGTTTGGAASRVTQSLAVSPDGPAPEWQWQNYTFGPVYTAYQCAAYPSGLPGQWEAFGFLTTSYGSAALYPVPVISVPLPASGLAPGSTYHVVFRQSGGDALNNYLQLGQVASLSPPAPWLYSTRGSGGPWTSATGQAIFMSAYDQAPGGPVRHLWQDSGARVTSMAWAAGSGQLLGVLEATQFPSGSPEAVLGAVTQVEWNGTVPTGTVQLA